MQCFTGFGKFWVKNYFLFTKRPNLLFEKYGFQLICFAYGKAKLIRDSPIKVGMLMERFVFIYKTTKLTVLKKYDFQLSCFAYGKAKLKQEGLEDIHPLSWTFLGKKFFFIYKTAKLTGWKNMVSS